MPNDSALFTCFQKLCLRSSTNRRGSNTCGKAELGAKLTSRGAASAERCVYQLMTIRLRMTWSRSEEGPMHLRDDSSDVTCLLVSLP